MSYKIEKSIPMPPGSGNGYKYPWRDMEVGDSFLVPNPVTESTQNSLRSCGARIGKLLKRKYAVRKVKEGLRVWRTK